MANIYETEGQTLYMRQGLTFVDAFINCECDARTQTHTYIYTCERYKVHMSKINISSMLKSKYITLDS